MPFQVGILLSVELLALFMHPTVRSIDARLVPGRAAREPLVEVLSGLFSILRERGDPVLRGAVDGYLFPVQVVELLVQLLDSLAGRVEKLLDAMLFAERHDASEDDHGHGRWGDSSRELSGNCEVVHVPEVKSRWTFLDLFDPCIHGQ
jgi:hypothetical protein